MVFLDKVFEIWMTEEVLRIVKFKIVTAQLIGVGNIGIFWHAPRHPVVAANSLVSIVISETKGYFDKHRKN